MWINVMDPYIVAGIIIMGVLTFGAYLVHGIYKMRTHDPSINTDQILDAIIPKPPQ